MSQERTHRKQDDKYFDNLKKMSEEFNLSDKRELKKYGLSYIYPEDAVREFIRLLKEELMNSCSNKIDGIIIHMKIDKLAGEKLI